MFNSRFCKKTASIILSANMLYSGMFNNSVLYVVNAETSTDVSAQMKSPEIRNAVSESIPNLSYIQSHEDTLEPQSEKYRYSILPGSTVSLKDLLLGAGFFAEEDADSYLSKITAIRVDDSGVISAEETEEGWQISSADTFENTGVLQIEIEGQTFDISVTNRTKESSTTVFTETDGVTHTGNISVHGTDNDFSENVELNAGITTDRGDLEKAVSTQALVYANFLTFDVSLNEEQSGYEVDFAFPVPVKGNDYYIYRVDDGVVTKLEGSVSISDDEGALGVHFTTDKLGSFVFAYTKDFDYYIKDAEYNYSFTTNDSVSLRTILIESGVIEEDYANLLIANITSVSSENPDVLVVEMVDENCLIDPQQSFETEILNIETASGQTVPVTIIDAREENLGFTLFAAGNESNQITITPNNFEVIYGNEVPELTATVSGLNEGDSITYDIAREEGSNAGTYKITVSNVKIKNSSDQDVTDQYMVTCQEGQLTINPAPVSLTANSVIEVYDGTVKTVSGYTCNVEGVHFEDVSSYASRIDVGEYTVDISGAIVNETKDTTGNYIVSELISGSLRIINNPVTKTLTGFNGNLATYQIVINADKYELNSGNDMVFKDVFSSNQEIIYSTIQVQSEQTILYDYSGQTGTFTIPDQTTVTITYTTRVTGKIGSNVSFGNTSILNDNEKYKAFVSETKTITPTGTDIEGSDGVYKIELFVYASGSMNSGLGGATFRLLDANQRPVIYKTGDKAGQQVTYTTGDNGYVTVELDEGDVSIKKNTAYYLEMTKAPVQSHGEGLFTYYKKDTTLYGFMITDSTSYSGGVYRYSNGDTLKVRCYPEDEGGVNVTKHFSGNYSPEDEVKNNIKFTLQKENTLGDDWIDVESHTYEEFSFGLKHFTSKLDPTATYRIIENNADVDGIQLNTSYSVTYYQQGKMVEDSTNEFSVNPDDGTYSFELVVTNEYVKHELKLVKFDDNTGTLLSGAEFSVFAASSPDNKLKSYTTDENGTIIIRKADSGIKYEDDVLYYAVETKNPEGYILPSDPEKIYFYFSSESGNVPSELPTGETAIDLSKSYNTVTIGNKATTVKVPVTVLWGSEASASWPEAIQSVDVKLYQTVNGVITPAELPDVTLTKESFYNNTSFVDLDAQDNSGNDITYSIVAEKIKDNTGADVTANYASSYFVSGTGWYILKVEAGTTLQVKKQWFDLDGEQITDSEKLRQKLEVTFDVYRTTVEPETSSLSHDQLLEFLKDADKVRSDIKLNNDNSWTQNISSLPQSDASENIFKYFALETTELPNNEVTYDIASGDNRVITIKNKQTPVTVTISANDYSKTYGDADPRLEANVTVADDEANVGTPSYDEQTGMWSVSITKNGETQTITYSLNRESGNDFGTYTITPSGNSSQSGYRIVFKTGNFTIRRKQATITAGARKTYGEDDPELVAISGVVGEDSLQYTVSRWPGDDVGEYTITVTGEELQGNYEVSFVEGFLTIDHKDAIVTAEDKTKVYGDDDPLLTAVIEGLVMGDAETVIGYELERDEGGNIGKYPIKATGEELQGNYRVSFVNGAFSITPAKAIVTAEKIEKTYGDVDPELKVEIEGVLGTDTLSYEVSRSEGQDIGTYDITVTGASAQGNYLVEYVDNTFTINPAQLTVTANDFVKAEGQIDPEDLTATVEGLKLYDKELTPVKITREGVTTYTYKRDDIPVLEFTVFRGTGEDRGSYVISTSGGEIQSNYTVTFVSGTFTIIGVNDIDVSQETVDVIDPSANPSYTYKAVLDLTEIGLESYTLHGFVKDSEGKYSRTFTLTDRENPNTEQLLIPEGSTITVTQQPNSEYDSNYGTSMTVDGVPFRPEGGGTYITEKVNNPYYYFVFKHTRICLPVEAMYTLISDDTEDSAKALTPSGYAGMPVGDEPQVVDSVYANKLQAEIGYVLPSDYYYIFNHASLYNSDNTPIENGSNVVAVKYDLVTATAKYKTNTEAEFKDVPSGAKLRLFYSPQYICQIGDTQYFTLNDALQDITSNTEATIEMLVDYTMPQSDKLVIPTGYNITLTTAETFEGAATITRDSAFTKGHMFANDGTLTLSNIILDGNNVAASDATLLNYSYYYDEIYHDEETGKDVKERIEVRAYLNVNEGTIIRNANGNNGGAVYINSGEVTIAENVSITGNNAVQGGFAYVHDGILSVNSRLLNNHATRGGAIYVEGGTVTVNKPMINNTAEHGGAVYTTGGTITIAGNANDNSAEYGGVIYAAGGNTIISSSITDNSAKAGGGAVFINRGTLTCAEGASMAFNHAPNGGAFYSEGGTVILSAGKFSNHTVSDNGGLAFINGGSFNVTGKSVEISDNSATNGNGGAIYYGGAGSINISNGSISNCHADNGYGGAIYQASGVITLSGGTIQNNSAIDGSGVYVNDGNATFSGNEISNNTASTGGGVGIGNASARLYFSGDEIIKDNKTFENEKKNVFLNVDSALVLNSSGLNGSADIGIYVSDTYLDTYGKASKVFGTYTSASNAAKFKNDRFSGLIGYGYEYKLIWSKVLTYNVRYLSDFDTVFNNFKAESSGTQKVGNTNFYPTSNYEIYDLVSNLYSSYSSKIDSTSVYAYTFADGARSFEEFITEVIWDNDQQKWKLVRNIGEPVYKDKIYIYYTDPAYVTITNNTEYKLTINPLTVFDKNTVDDKYGYPITIDYITQDTLRPITLGNLTLEPNHSIKMLFPGAKGKNWSFNGVFTDGGGQTIQYTLDAINDGESQSCLLPADGSINLSGKTRSEKGGNYEILFGYKTPICKINDTPYTSLKDAVQDVIDQDMHQATIEMLIDYVQPANDVPHLPEGYEITLTTAEPGDGILNYHGSDPTKATISRDYGNTGPAVYAEKAGDPESENLTSKLTIDNLIFDGKALAASGNGGAVATRNFDVSINNCEFKGYNADRGGAIFVNWGNLEVTRTNFRNCKTGTKSDKTGGGAIWTTAQILEAVDCDFVDCDCVTGSSQGGAIFHNIQQDNSAIFDGSSDKYPTGFSLNSKTYITNCNFTDCYSVGGSGGTVESDALDVYFTECTFDGSYSGKSGASGGAINVYANNEGSTSKECSLTIRDCNFNNCYARNGSTNGGAVRSTTKKMYVYGSTFNNCEAVNGGAISMTRNNATILEIGGTSFTNCIATSGSGGAVNASVMTFNMMDYDEKHSSLRNCSAKNYGGLNLRCSENNSIITITNASFENCVSTASNAGAVNASGKSLYITGLEDTVTFKNCTASGDGGAVYHKGTLDYFTNVSFENCEAGGSGGAASLLSTSTQISGGLVKNCIAQANGGGLYLSTGGTGALIDDCDFEGNKVTNSDSKGGAIFHNSNTLNFLNGSITKCSAAYGGGIYKNNGTGNLDGVTIVECIATISGGGIYNLGGNLNLNAVDINKCNAITSGGGIFHKANLYSNSGTNTISECYAKQGGGIYSDADLEMKNNTEITISECQAKNISISETGEPIISESFSADNLGGGIFKNSGKQVNNSSSVTVSKNKAYDGAGIYWNSNNSFSVHEDHNVVISDNIADHYGGGLYQNAGSISFSGVVKKNSAIQGGGFYYAGGKLNIKHGIIGGASEDGNIATEKGGGIFVADYLTIELNNDNKLDVNQITYNHANAEGGGIAVGGPNAIVKFTNNNIVRYNTMGEANTECNIYLDRNSNKVIQNGWMNAASYIGVYASDDQDAVHGMAGMPFATQSNVSNLNCYKNDRRPYFYGVQGAVENQVIWSSFVCKFTDTSDQMLYLDADQTKPAAFIKLENGENGTNENTAFGAIAKGVTLYNNQGEVYNDAFKIQMYVKSYTATDQMFLAKNKTVTFTTASTEADEIGMFYNGDPRYPSETYATINRGGTFTKSLIQIKGSNLTFTNITIDGNQKTGSLLYITNDGTTANVNVGSNTVFQNGYTTTNGGFAYLYSGELTIDGGSVLNCNATQKGGAVFVNNATLKIREGSLISGCSSLAQGGAVFVENQTAGKVEMSGGAIRDNTSSSRGGGIAVGGGNPRLYFSGNPIVINNKLSNGTTNNVELNQNSNSIINASGLGGDAEIGIYVSDEQQSGHGVSGKPFGTWSVENNLFCFINDRNTNLRGMKNLDSTTDNKIYWAANPFLELSTVVVSDIAADKDVLIQYEVEFEDHTFNGTYGDMTFVNGVANVSMKSGETQTAVNLPADLRTGYTITRKFTEEQSDNFITNIKQIKTTGDVQIEGERITGNIGENLTDDESTSSGKSELIFTHTRYVGDLKISKVLDSVSASDREFNFPFEVTFGDTSIKKMYTSIRTTDNQETVEEMLSVEDGFAKVYLKGGESLTIKNLPKNLTYSIKEDLSSYDSDYFRTKIKKNDDQEVSSLIVSGFIGEHNVQVSLNNVDDEKTFLSDVSYSNVHMGIVCKITNRNRTQLYYDDGGKLVPAVYDRLENAFEQVNRGGLKTVSGGTVTGTLRIEMVVPEYAMEETAILNDGHTVILSTALKTDRLYPYEGEDGGTASIERGSDFNKGSMISDRGTLTLDNIILDGENVSASAKGGIIQVIGNKTLTVNETATLKNSVVATDVTIPEATGSGGAIWLSSGSTLVMNGMLTNCKAVTGGGIYAEDGFRSITINGTIEKCVATAGNGGGIRANSGTTVTINASAILRENIASVSGDSSGNGGAICSKAPVVVKGTVSNNTAAINGGGIYMEANTAYTMSSGSLNGNTAEKGYGGAVYVQDSAKITGGEFINNKALSGFGGAVYTTTAASVTISYASFEQNTAKTGGAIYDQAASFTMSSGSMIDNSASEKGGAVYVAGNHVFNMSGGMIGNISKPNYSPQGAVSTGESAVLKFSGDATVTANKHAIVFEDGSIVADETIMNVFLGYDSNTIITTSGLRESASIGIYVKDGTPVEGVDKPLYYDHGIAGRHFGTYTGTNINSANLDKFINDRDNSLTGVAGAQENSKALIAWPGNGLTFTTYSLSSRTKDLPDDPSIYDIEKARIERSNPVSNTVFVLTAVNNSEDSDDDVVVWQGASAGSEEDMPGLVTVPWTAAEKALGNAASFKGNSTYILREIASNEEDVIPGGYWVIKIERDNAVTWSYKEISDDAPDKVKNRILTPVNPIDGDAVVEKAFIGDLFNLYNDVQPTITFDANGDASHPAKLADNSERRTDIINFTSTQFRYDYSIKETNPTRPGYVFMNWNTVKEPTESNPGKVYERTNDITFARTTDNDDLTLYAQWMPVICKITDRNDNLLYVNGSPAVYTSLKDAFDAFNTATFTSTPHGLGRATNRKIKMLVEEYVMNEPVTLARGKTLILTTASVSDKDGYPGPFTGSNDTTCVIKRGFKDANNDGNDESLITSTYNLTLTNVTLDGNAGTYTETVNGGLISVTGAYSTLGIGEGTTLQNSAVVGNGGAVYLASGTSMTTIAGVIKGNTASAGAGIYVSEGATLNLSGAPAFGSGNDANKATVDDSYKGKKNGEENVYIDSKARQDIYIAGYASPSEDEIVNVGSLVVTGNITSGDGSIWVWAERDNHYLMTTQFGLIDAGKDFNPESLKAFRNARPDDETGADALGEYLYGVLNEDDGMIHWNGIEGTHFVILRKVHAVDKNNNDYEVQTGAPRFEIRQRNRVVTLKQEDGTIITLDQNYLQMKPNGVFFIGELPYGQYELVEYIGSSMKTFTFFVDGGGLWYEESKERKSSVDPADTVNLESWRYFTANLSN